MSRKFLALIAVPFLLVAASGCAPECVDYFDCASKATATQPYTCDNGTCKPGSPFPADAGT